MPLIYGLVGFVIGAFTLFLLGQKKVARLEKDLRQYKRQQEKNQQECKILEQEYSLEFSQRIKELNQQHQAEKEELEDNYRQNINQITQEYHQEIESLKRLTQKPEPVNVKTETFDRFKLQPTTNISELNLVSENLYDEDDNPFDDKDETLKPSKISNLRFIPQNRSHTTSDENINPFEITYKTEDDFQEISVVEEPEVPADYVPSFANNVIDSEASELEEFESELILEETEEPIKANLEESELMTMTSSEEIVDFQQLNFDTSPGQILEEPEIPEPAPVNYDTEIIDFEEIYFEPSVEGTLEEPELPEPAAVSYDTEIIDFEDIYVNNYREEQEKELEVIPEGDQHFVITSDSDISDFEELYLDSLPEDVVEESQSFSVKELPASTSDTEIIDFQELYLDSLAQGVVDHVESTSQDEQVEDMSEGFHMDDFDLLEEPSEDFSASNSELLALLDPDDFSGNPTNLSIQEQKQISEPNLNEVNDINGDDAEKIEFVFDDFDSPSSEEDDNLITDSQIAQFISSDDSDQVEPSVDFSFDDLLDTEEPQYSTDELPDIFSDEENNDLKEINFNEEDFGNLLSDSFYQNETEIKMDKKKNP